MIQYNASLKEASYTQIATDRQQQTVIDTHHSYHIEDRNLTSQTQLLHDDLEVNINYYRRYEVLQSASIETISVIQTRTYQ
jgi:hypothetical protein